MSYLPIDTTIALVAGVAECLRSNLFREWHAVPNPGIVYYPPEFGTDPASPIPTGTNLETTATPQQWYYPQARRRFMAKYLVRTTGFLSNVWFGWEAAKRVVNGDTRRGKTAWYDSLLVAQSAVGLLTVLGETRLGRFRASYVSAILGVAGILASLGEAGLFSRGGRTNLVSLEQTLRPLVLLGLNVALGGALQRGILQGLEKDKMVLANLRNPARSGWRLKIDRQDRVDVRPYAREELPSVPIGKVPASVQWLDVHHTTYHASESVGGVQRVVGTIETHQPYWGGRPIGKHEITLRIPDPALRNENRAIRMRDSIFNQFPETRRGWVTQTTTVMLGSAERYERTLVPGFRVTASVPKLEWAHDGLSGRPILSCVGMKDIEIDHRPSWHSLQGVRGLATQVVLFLVGRIIGRIRNTLDSIQSTRQFVTYLMHTERSYFGFATHPQRVPLFTLLPRISVQGLAPLGGKRFWRWATRSVIMGEKPGPRQPLPTPSWLRRQWVQFHGSESAPTGSGDWQTMPSQGFLKRWAERKGRG